MAPVRVEAARYDAGCRAPPGAGSTKRRKTMIRTPMQVPDPVLDPRGASLTASIWDSKTGTVIETSRKLPHAAKQG
ncbi:hypothetical protein SAMN04515671_1145 [Nakamurella panacisegetis]|uniref:Uncharacterized protein n=1 Tax=Nakamurella panacisegetis TaxID=1090615 RepID=A0A1H0K321_9ACTN|nr:hypothetical protein SAMN04515671_1145 [Nakamurella panacisegetis]